MRRHATWTLWCLLCLCAPTWAQEPDDGAFLLPGSFSEQTTVADLQARFGKDNVRIVEAVDNDDERGVVVFADDPTRRARFAFHDDAALEGVRSITVRDRASRWRGKGGVRVGMPLTDVAGINGKPFAILGFDEAHRGIVHDQWSPALDENDGTLGKLDVGEDDQMYFGVEFGPRGDANDLPPGAYPRGDNALSNDPRYPRLGELFEVTEINATTSLDDEW